MGRKFRNKAKGFGNQTSPKIFEIHLPENNEDDDFDTDMISCWYKFDYEITAITYGNKEINDKGTCSTDYSFKKDDYIDNGIIFSHLANSIIDSFYATHKTEIAAIIHLSITNVHCDDKPILE